MKREKRIIITLSTEEWETIKAASTAQGLSVASFLRQAALEYANKPRIIKQEKVTDGVQGLANAFISYKEREGK
jgi:uncharacterized protein (DUF1778 family)